MQVMFSRDDLLSSGEHVKNVKHVVVFPEKTGWWFVEMDL